MLGREGKVRCCHVGCEWCDVLMVGEYCSVLLCIRRVVIRLRICSICGYRFEPHVVPLFSDVLADNAR